MIVEILAVNPEFQKEKIAGGTYECFHIQYRGEKGPRDEYVATSFLSKNEKLHAQLNSLSVGDAVKLTHQQNGQYKNLISVEPTNEAVPAAKPYTPKPFGGGGFAPKSNYVDNSVGMQVGNALNNAALLLAHGAIEGTLKEVAETVLRLSEELKANVTAGKYANKATTTEAKKTAVSSAKQPTKTAPKKVEEPVDEDVLDDDIPW